MGNGFNVAAEAFATEAAEALVREGASGDGALGNDVAASFNLGTGLSSWRSALSGGVRNHILIMGDSNVEHQPAVTTRWAQQLRLDLITYTGIAQGGEGFRMMGLPEWTTTGTWNDIGADVNLKDTAADIGPYGKAFATQGNTNIKTWTKPGTFAAHDRFEVYGADDDFLGQQAEYSIDGGAFTATSWDFGPSLGVRLVKQAVVTPITTTLRLRPSNASFPTTVVGAAFYQGTTGLVVHNLAIGGSMVSDAVGTPRQNGLEGRRLAIIDDLQPKLTIIWTGTNEYLNFNSDGVGARKQMTLENWYNYYNKLVTKARQYGDVLMVMPQAVQTGAAGNQLAQEPIPSPHREFERAARRLAYEKDCGYISIHALWGSYARAAARGFQSDAHHISTAGHGAVFRYLSQSIRRAS